MARITPGNRLYLYALLKATIGVGKQTMLADVASALEADDIMPSDLECLDYREVVDALDDIVRVTVFKRGRVYVTLLERADYDQILATPAEKAQPQQKKASGRKTWKSKRAGKVPQPAKPRPKNRPIVLEEPVTQDSDPQAGEAKPEKAPAAELEPMRAEAAQKTDAPVPCDQTTPEGIEEPSQEPQKAEAAQTPEDVTHLDTEVPEAPSVPPIRLTIISAPTEDLEPAEDTPADAAEPTQVESAPSEEAAEDTSTTDEDVPSTSFDTGTPEAASESPVDETENHAEAPCAGQAETTAEPEPPQTSVHYSSLMEQILENQRRHDEVLEEIFEGIPPRPQAAPELTHTAPLAPRKIFPTHFATEVLCGNKELSALYEILPFDVDPMALLDEDWQVSESCESYTFEDSHLTFPLRYLRNEDNQPVSVTLRRVGPGPSGKRWVLEKIDVGDEVGFWGLPTKDEGAWSHLSSAQSGPCRLVSPRRNVATFAHLGNIREVLESVAALAEDEPWGEGREVLIEYLSVTFFRLMRQERIAYAEDGTSAVCDTGLLTREGDPLFCHFTDCEGHWHLQGFSTEAGGLKPECATYIDRTRDLAPVSNATVDVEGAVRDAFGEGIDRSIRRALWRAERSHRIATCAYDPQTDSLRLLVPIETPEGEVRALVLAPSGESRYCATALLPLSVAYACARVVSSEQPQWLMAGID